jgi:hypothetical protein
MDTPVPRATGTPPSPWPTVARAVALLTLIISVLGTAFVRRQAEQICAVREWFVHVTALDDARRPIGDEPAF